jgi:UDP-N-acetylmuramoylalanine--D-glutamate ligase
MPQTTLILGGGRSALGAAKLLKKTGQDVRVSDIKEAYPEQAEALRSLGIDLLIGPQTPQLLEGVKQLIVSPGLSPEIPILQAARQRRIPIRSEIDLALDHFRGQVIGVTGTNGKSTTTTLIAHILQKLGHKALASGNIGVPPSLLIADGQAPDVFVLELSSYQLDYSKPIANTASLFISFSEDHMERHRTMERYFAAKWKLITATRAEGLCIMPQTIVRIAQTYKVQKPKAQLVQIISDDERPLRFADGPIVHINTERGVVGGDGIAGLRELPPDLSFHNQLNVTAALLAVQIVKKTPWQACAHTLPSYSWLAYRFERIGSVRGRPVWNDSKSTNVESTLVALKSIKEPAILLLGGYPKGEAFHPIAAFKDKICRLIAFGAAGARIAQDLAALHPIVYPTLREALEALPQTMREESASIVFSPACSSFDEFQNFEERGAFFNLKLGPYLDR